MLANMGRYNVRLSDSLTTAWGRLLYMRSLGRGAVRSVTDTAPPLCPQRGETALHMAARAGQAEVVRCLLRNGALVDARARVGAVPAGPACRVPPGRGRGPGLGRPRVG